jgi:hypothetical protein
MTQRSVADYATQGDSKSLTAIDGKPFTIVAVEDSNYDETPGVKITTSQAFKIEGTEFKKFHTTRHAIVGFFSEKVRADLKSGTTIGPVRTEKTKAKTKGVNDYWVLVDV